MRVLITGVGAVTPLGDTAAETWAALLAGESGVGLLDYPDLPVRLGAVLRTDPAERLDRVEGRNLDRSQRVALLAAREAWADAGAPEVEPTRLAVVVGTGIGGAITLLDQWDTLREKGSRRVSPFTVPMLMPNGPAGLIGLELGAQGAVRSTVSACASGADAIALAYDTIRSGQADVVVAGGTEACIHPLPLAGFAQMRALSTRHDDPEAASRSASPRTATTSPRPSRPARAPRGRCGSRSRRPVSPRSATSTRTPPPPPWATSPRRRRSVPCAAPYLCRRRSR